MHLKNPLLFGLMAILLLGGTITPVLSQSSPDLGIVINEVELKLNQTKLIWALTQLKLNLVIFCVAI